LRKYKLLVKNENIFALLFKGKMGNGKNIRNYYIEMYFIFSLKLF